jgi:hypothetical protein
VIRGDERGSALVAAVGVLAAMTLLATMSLLAGSTDLILSKRLARERAAFYAAESALATAAAELASGALPVPEASFHSPWPAPGIAASSWQDGEWACARRVCLIPDVADADGDPGTPVVLFDRSFGYADSPLSRGGYPVLQLLVSVTGGGSRQSVVAEVTPVACAPVAAAAWLAAGPLDLSGDIRVAGTATLPALDSCGNPVRLANGAAVEGGPAPEPGGRFPDGVLSLLNAGATLPKLEDLPEPPAAGALNGVSWSRRSYSGGLEGRGIIIVHNPLFDPVKHEASRRAIESGTPGEGYDPAYSHLDPTRQPARLEIPSGGTFEGVIIADVLGGVTARFTLTGALVTLSRSVQLVAASAPLRINGDRAAVERSGRGGLRHQVGFRPVAAAEPSEPCP